MARMEREVMIKINTNLDETIEKNETTYRTFERS